MQGKSSLIHSFLEKNETPRESLVLEYSFGRKSTQKHGIDKTICHVWEYGGKLEMMKDVLTVIPVEPNFYFCIMIDLNKIRSLWNVLEVCLETIEKNYKNQSLEIIIIGGHYDLFKNLGGYIFFFYLSISPIVMSLTFFRHRSKETDLHNIEKCCPFI